MIGNETMTLVALPIARPSIVERDPTAKRAGDVEQLALTTTEDKPLTTRMRGEITGAVSRLIWLALDAGDEIAEVEAAVHRRERRIERHLAGCMACVSGYWCRTLRDSQRDLDEAEHARGVAQRRLRELTDRLERGRR